MLSSLIYLSSGYACWDEPQFFKTMGVLMCRLMLLGSSGAHDSRLRALAVVAVQIVAAALGIVAALVPLATLHCHAHQRYCAVGELGSAAAVCEWFGSGDGLARQMSGGPPMPGERPDPLPEWCDGLPGSHYSHIQKTYWGLGFFAYWQLKQLPNFLLAGPMIFFAGVPCSIIVHN